MKKNPMFMSAGVAVCFGLGLSGIFVPGTDASSSSAPGAAFVPQSVQFPNSDGFAGTGVVADDPSALTFEQVEAMRKAAADKEKADNLMALLEQQLVPGLTTEASPQVPSTPGVPSAATEAALERLSQVYSPAVNNEMAQRQLAALQEAFGLVGQRYVWGGESPAEGGWDCSGLVQYVYGHQGISVPRVAHDQWMAATHIRESDAIPGDLVFWLDKNGYAYHVGLYVGDGMAVEAANSRVGIVYRKLWNTDQIVFGTYRDRASISSGVTMAHVTVVQKIIETRTVGPRPTVTLTQTIGIPTIAPSPTPVPSSTVTLTQTSTGTPTRTQTPSDTVTETEAPTETATETVTETEAPTETATETVTETESPEPTETETVTTAPEPTETETVTSSPTETETVTSSPTETQTPTPPPAIVEPPVLTATSTPAPEPEPTETQTGTRTETEPVIPTSPPAIVAPPVVTETVTSTETETQTDGIIETHTPTEPVAVVVSPTATQTPTATASAAVLAVPAAVVYADRAGSDQDVYVVPQVAGVSYQVNGVVVPAGEYAAGAGQVVTVVPVAGNGYQVNDAPTWSHQFATDASETYLAGAAAAASFDEALTISLP